MKFETMVRSSFMKLLSDKSVEYKYKKHSCQITFNSSNSRNDDINFVIENNPHIEETHPNTVNAMHNRLVQLYDSVDGFLVYNNIELGRDEIACTTLYLALKEYLYCEEKIGSIWSKKLMVETYDSDTIGLHINGVKYTYRKVGIL